MTQTSTDEREHWFVVEIPRSDANEAICINIPRSDTREVIVFTEHKARGRKREVLERTMICTQNTAMRHKRGEGK